MDNVEEMDKFLEKYNFPKLDQEEIENLNRPITSTEIETVIRKLPANKSPGPEGFVLSHAFLKNNKHLDILSSQLNQRKERTSQNHKT